ncbi:MAG: transporter substrate-binding domain-containing protein [Desulfobaccales bacterium]
MNFTKGRRSKGVFWGVIIGLLVLINGVSAADLQEIKQKGVLRHLGIPYANFVTGAGDGMDVELVQLFAKNLGVKYEFVETTWENVIGDLTGIRVKPHGDDIEVIGKVPIRGDIVACGFTVLPWRKKIVDYSLQTFPIQVWLVATAKSSLQPITPSKDIAKDISQVKKLLKGHQVLTKANTCLSAEACGLTNTKAKVEDFPGALNELAPALIKGEAEATVLEVPDALVALEKWPGKLKIIGPLTTTQDMAAAFAKTSPQLRDAFNQFLQQCRADGTYLQLVKKYFPEIVNHYPEFFAQK